MSSGGTTQADTRTELLDVAQELIQTRGYNGFSFRDLAERVRIKTASVHYHFPTKVDLARALILRARELMAASMSRIDVEEPDASRKLRAYARQFRDTLDAGNRMCLCGMLAADHATLDESLVTELRRSFEDQEEWLRKVLSAGQKSGELMLSGSARDEARKVLSTLEGAMLIARTFEDRGRFDVIAKALISSLASRLDG